MTEWREHQRLCVAAAFLDSLAMRFRPQAPRRVDMPSAWLVDEARVEIGRSAAAGEIGAVIRIALEDEARLNAALRAYECRSGDVTLALMVLALLAGIAVHAGFLASIVSLAANGRECMAAGLIAAWAACGLAAGLCADRWVSPRVNP